MKNIIFSLLTVIASTSFSHAEDVFYPLDIQMRVWPEKIHYGDICFLIFSVTNQGDETLLLPYGSTFLNQMGGQLSLGENQVLLLYGDLNSGEGTMCLSSTPYAFPGHPLKPGETMDFHIRMIWLPLPEFAHREQAKEFLRLVNQREKDYKIQFGLSYREAYRSTSRPRFDKNSRFLTREDFPADELIADELEAKGYKIAENPNIPSYTVDKPECSVRILPRPQEEIDLLQSWYLELPTTTSTDSWTMEHVFAHPYHVNGSPFKMDAPTPFELGRKRDPFNAAYRAFFASMEKRTPESLARIERTNQLAAKILECAKEPDTTISQNMVEFIQLRSLLVDMRYAENPKAAFQKLMDFVDQSQDKDLWVNFIYEIGLYSIQNYTHFPPEKVEQYRDRFAERFQIERKGLLN